jgi:Transcriptional regulators
VITIKDIANKAGVSSATVSMALNGKGNISEKTKRKLLRIAKEMNYIPSSSAKALKTNRSMTIGLVVGSLRNTYFTDIIASVEDVARHNGYDVFICDAERNLEKAGECLTALQSRGVDGIIFSLSLSITDEFSMKLRKMVDSGIKLVSLTRCVEDIGIPIVSFIDEECLRTMIERLFSNGHE